MPVVFLLYGKKIRGKSTFAPAPDLAYEKKLRLARDAEASAGVTDGNGDGREGEEGVGRNEAGKKEA